PGGVLELPAVARVHRLTGRPSSKTVSRLDWKEGAMKHLIAILTVAVLAGSVLPARAAGAKKGKAATPRGQLGGRPVGDGKLGPGFEQTFKGVGNTIVEGAKYSGHTIKDFFSKAFGA